MLPATPLGLFLWRSRSLCSGLSGLWAGGPASRTRNPQRGAARTLRAETCSLHRGREWAAWDGGLAHGVPGLFLSCTPAAEPRFLCCGAGVPNLLVADTTSLTSTFQVAEQILQCYKQSRAPESLLPTEAERGDTACGWLQCCYRVEGRAAGGRWEPRACFSCLLRWSLLKDHCSNLPHVLIVSYLQTSVPAL